LRKPTTRLATWLLLAQSWFDFVYQVDGLAAGKKPKLTLDQASLLNSHAEGIITGIDCS